jgi:phosphonate metabolism protein (transferase hexapeptide repeat family)
MLKELVIGKQKKMKSKLFRLLLLPFGLLNKVIQISKDGARDLHNKLRFKDVKIDKGICIDDRTKMGKNIHILADTIINNSFIDSFTYIGKNGVVQNAQIGKFCSIANDVCIGPGKHPIDNFSTATIFYRKKNTLNIELIEQDIFFEEYETVTIGHDVWIGTRAIVLDGITVGNGAVIAANSVVTKDVPPYAIVAGVPAKIIKYRFNDDKINKLNDSKWWELDLNEIKQKINNLNS